MVRALQATAVAVLLLVTGCTAEGVRDEPRVGPVQYGISYTVGAAEYDEEASQAAFDACADLPGASFAGSEDSLPPGLSVRFEGTKTEQGDLEACLRALPDTHLTVRVPFVVPVVRGVLHVFEPPPASGGPVGGTGGSSAVAGFPLRAQDRPVSTAPPERIEVADLVLRRERLGDEELIAHAVMANLEHLRPWMPWASPAAAEVSAQRARLASAEQSWQAGSDYTYALLNHVATRVLGIFGLHRRIGPRAIEMGYWLSHDVVGCGYATAAAGALTAAAMNHCGIDRIEIHCDEANHRSQKVPQRLGYVLDRVEDDDIEAPAEIGHSMIWVFRQRQEVPF